jgi:ABC-type sugar transport system ATPase subunit
MAAGETKAEQRNRSGGVTPSPPAVSMKGIRKSFGVVEVLHGVDFEVLPGEVHVLAGENGAGKSTLIRILSGVHSEFSGELRIRGRRVHFSSPSQAAAAGVATIHQELSLVPTMSIADNLFLGRERKGRWGQVDRDGQEEAAISLLSESGFEVSPHLPVVELPISQQQVLEIARALARDASVVVFDEPTSALNETEVEALFRRIEGLKLDERGVVYISHKMEEIYRLADRITVLRDGYLVGTSPAGDLPPDELVRWMVGRDLASRKDPESRVGGTPVLELAGLSVEDPRIRGRMVVDGVDLTLHAGEILGLAGLQGSGKSQLLHAIFGALPGRVQGGVSFLGNPLMDRTPGRCIERGIVLLTSDRKGLGLAPEQSVVHSVSLASLSSFSGPLGWMRRGVERAEVDRMTSDFRLRAPDLNAPVRVLSGGNQQKVYLARCLMPDPKVLLLDEPTRGIDVGAKADIYELMRGWAKKGVGIVLVTSEMEELLTLSDRILVMHRGCVTAEFTRDQASKDRVLAAAMGHMVGAEAGADGWEGKGGFEPREGR